MRLPFGRPILVMLILALLAGGLAVARPQRPRPAVLLWLPSPTHEKLFRPLLDGWTTADGSVVGLERIAGRPLNIRLQSMFMGGRRDPGVPDLATVEIGLVGRYFRPPVAAVGFLPLDRFLDTRGERRLQTPGDPGRAGWCARDAAGAAWTHDGSAWRPTPGARVDTWRQRLQSGRLAPWSKQGVVFGIPYDLHPTALCYRADLFAEAGIDLEAVVTWEEFRQACVRYVAFQRAALRPHAMAFEAQDTGAEFLLTLLLQRGFNPTDDDGVHLDDPRLAEGLAFYLRLIAGDEAVAWPSPGSTAVLAGHLASGLVAACLCPDWRLPILKDNQREALRGRLRLRPLPVFAPGDAPTSTWGGTMVGITRACPDPDRAWEVIERLVLSPAALRQRIASNSFLPPLVEQWDDPAFAQADPWMHAGQAALRLYVDLGAQVPRRCVTSETGLAQAAIANVMNRAVRSGERDPQRLRADLAAEQADLIERIRQSRFEDGAP